MWPNSTFHFFEIMPSYQAASPEISGFRERARHSIGLGINAGSSYQYAKGEEPEFLLKCPSQRVGSGAYTSKAALVIKYGDFGCIRDNRFLRSTSRR